MAKILPLPYTNGLSDTPLSFFHKMARRYHIRLNWNLVDESGAPHNRVFHVKLTIFIPNSEQTEVFEAMGKNIQTAKQSAATAALENSTLFKTLLDSNQTRRRRSEFNEKHRCFQDLIDNVPSQNGPRSDILEIARVLNIPVNFVRLQDTAPPVEVPRACDTVYRVALEMAGRQYVGQSTTRAGAEQDASVAALNALRRVLTSSTTFMRSEKVHPPRLGQRLHIQPGNPIWKLQVLVGLHHERPVFKNFLAPLDEGADETTPKSYHCICSVPSLGTVECTGKSKAISRSIAAKLMLERLIPSSAQQKLTTHRRPRPPPAFHDRPVAPKSRPPQTKTRSQFKVDRTNPSYGEDVNPVQRLDYFCLAQSLGRPVYVLVHDGTTVQPSGDSVGSHRAEPEFAYEIRIGTDHQVVGPRARNKRLARRMAAELMLEALGFQRPKSPDVQGVLRPISFNTVQQTSPGVTDDASGSSHLSSVPSPNPSTQDAQDSSEPAVNESQQRHVEFSCTHDILLLDSPVPRRSSKSFGHQSGRSNRTAKLKSSPRDRRNSESNAAKKKQVDVAFDAFGTTPIGHWAASEEAQTVGRCWPLRRTRSCSDLTKTHNPAMGVSTPSSDPTSNCQQRSTAHSMETPNEVTSVTSFRSNLRLLAQLAVFYLEETLGNSKSNPTGSVQASNSPPATRLLLSLCQRFRVPCQFVDQAPPSNLNDLEPSLDAYQYNTVLTIGGTLPELDINSSITVPNHVIIVRASGRTLEEARREAALSAFRQLAQEIQS